jgi:putative hydrolase of the HAD superfamily
MTAATTFDVLLFDLGGVLIDFAGFEELGPLMTGAVDRAAVRERWIGSESVQRFERAEITPRRFAAGVVEELQLDLSPDEFLTAFVEWARGPYPGARSLLEWIPKSYRIACLSNSNELHTPLHRRSMEPLMERYYFSDELGLVKPEREIFEHVIRDMDASPGRIAFFDDTPVNVEAAREVGIAAYEIDGIAALEAQLQCLGIVSPKRAP